MNTKYIKINQGNEFGLVDILYSIYRRKKENVQNHDQQSSSNNNEITLENWGENNNLSMLKR